MNKKVPEEALPGSWSPALMPDQGFPPLTLEWQPFHEKNREWDALLFACSESGAAAQFAALYQRDGTPRQIAFAASRLTELTQRDKILPLLIVPYLSEERLLELEQRQVSALDLCGNGIVRAPGQFTVFRTGYSDRFNRSRPLKNIYRGVSSLAARAFLLQPEYAEIRELQQEIVQRGGEISLPTLSKALTELEEDLIVRRVRQADKPQSRGVRLLQPEKLLSRLEAGYTPPKVSRSFVGKAALEPALLRQALQENAHKNEVRLISTGLGAAARYATLAMESTLYVYTNAIDALLQGLPATATSLFPNLSIQQTEDPIAFFDPRADETGFPWASPITAYLEMRQGDERLRQTAAQIREMLLPPLQEARV